jgi:hypothetical protein
MAHYCKGYPYLIEHLAKELQKESDLCAKLQELDDDESYNEDDELHEEDEGLEGNETLEEQKYDTNSPNHNHNHNHNTQGAHSHMSMSHSSEGELLRKMKDSVNLEIDRLEGERYYKELFLDRLKIDGSKKYRRPIDGEGLLLWQGMFGYNSMRGLLVTFIQAMNEHYQSVVGEKYASKRPLWKFNELEFLQLELLPFFAQRVKVPFEKPKQVIERFGSIYAKEEIKQNLGLLLCCVVFWLFTVF